MRLRNILIVVKDIERSKKFYHDLFGLDIVLDNDGNIILTEGLVLQEEKIWKDFLGKTIIPESNSCELYFEEPDLEGFVDMELSDGRRCRLAVGKSDKGWGFEIDGVYEEDCFEFIPYAG